MLKRIVIILILITLILESFSFAQDTSGEIVFRDALYGAVIGAIIGGSVYLADQDDPGEKFGIGIAAGTIGGLIFGITEARSAVEVRRGKISLNPPTMIAHRKDGSLVFSAKILKIEF